MVGGGVAGLAAATILTERGARVTLLERAGFVGGRAGSWLDRGDEDGAAFELEHGFHGFFRQYYNLRALLRRFDPALACLAPLGDYPVLGPGGRVQSFRGLPATPLLSLPALLWRTPYLGARGLVRTDARGALEMLAFAAERTYARFDARSAAAYLDSLALPPRARRMLFDVFSRSTFNAEEELSAAELLMNFHFYFTGNPEGLVFDVARRPHSRGLWEPLAARLRRLGAAIRLGVGARRVARDGPRLRVEHDEGAESVDLVVLALAVPDLKRLVADSPRLDDPRLRDAVAGLEVARPYCVWRLWLDRPLAPDRSPFAGVTGLGRLDNLALYPLLEEERAQHAAKDGGAVVELQALALPRGLGEEELRTDLLRGLHAAYPETRAARIIRERFAVREDCSSFPPGSHARRPGVATRIPGLALAGDFVRLPLPCALMERAATAGILAANTLLAAQGVAPEPLRSVPRQGLLAPPAWLRRR